MTNQNDRPNILWICSDQQRYDTIGALGNPHVRTPNLDRLVAEGAAFSHAFCQTPICTPSRAAFLTGLYPSAVHACTNGNEVWGEAAPLVTKLLADEGYDCGLAGKLHLAGAHQRIEPRPVNDGYRVFHWSHHPKDDWPEGHAYKEWVTAKGEDLGKLYEHPERIPPELHQTSWCADMAIDFIEETRHGPWLMSVNTFDPHAPFDPPQEYRDHFDPDSLPDPPARESDVAAQQKLAGVDFQTSSRYPATFTAKEVGTASSAAFEDAPEGMRSATFSGREVKAAYYAMIELIDHNVGRMVEALERSGQRDNTIIIFTSDHGEILGDHGLLLKGCRFYEGLVRVPLIISWPGHFESELVSNALVELLDLPPTLLEACGTPCPRRMQGRSLLPILTGTADPRHHRDFVRCSYYHTLNPVAHPEFEGSYATMIRDHRYKLVVYHGHETGELFDLERDPGEFENLWDDPDHREVRFELMKRSFDALAFAVDIGPEQVAYY